MMEAQFINGWTVNYKYDEFHNVYTAIAGKNGVLIWKYECDNLEKLYDVVQSICEKGTL